MKFFWFAFGLFLFLLAVTPCCEDEGHLETIPETTLKADDHGHDSHAHDVCSPFCTCASCGCHGCSAETFQLPVAIDLAEEVQPADMHISHYSFQFVSDFEATIWQPPRLG